MRTARAKPFVKWAGGKGQLLTQLEALLPAGFAEQGNVTYIEPFVGGGAMFFYMLRAHRNIKSAVISDINADLTSCYQTVRDSPAELVESLSAVQAEYYALRTEEERKEFYMRQRERFNSKTLGRTDSSALLLFLNRTCFNGLYRVNKAGRFNVPFGRYPKPAICDAATVYADSELLQRVEIMTGDFENTFSKITGDTFFYFDPPYKPLSDTSYFNDYAKEGFGDGDQIRLKNFCDRLDGKGVNFMLSNSDCEAAGGGGGFFKSLYAGYRIDRVLASRNVNAVASKRGKITEIVVRNYRTATLFQ